MGLASVRRPNRTCSFPASDFHEDALLRDVMEGIRPTRLSIREWTFLSPVGLIQSTSLLGRRCPGLSLKELSTSTPLLISSSFSSQPSSPAAFPSPLGCRSLNRAAFTTLQVLPGRPTAPTASLPTSL